MANLRLVPPTPIVALSIRRLTKESLGAMAWYSLWEELGLTPNERVLSAIQYENLWNKVVETFSVLDRKDYASFCSEAHQYAQGLSADSALQRLPHFQSVRKEYVARFEDLHQQQKRVRNQEDLGSMIAGGVGVVMGAIAAGELAEYVTRLESFKNFADYFPALSLISTSERVASAVGGILAGIVTWIGASGAFQKYGAALRQQEQNLEKRIYDDFTGKVTTYIKTHPSM